MVVALLAMIAYILACIAWGTKRVQSGCMTAMAFLAGLLLLLFVFGTLLPPDPEMERLRSNLEQYCNGEGLKLEGVTEWPRYHWCNDYISRR